MINSSNQSEVRRLLNQIDAEFEAARQGLQGLSQGVARHAFITARADRAAEYHQQLAGIVGEDEAIRLIVERQEQETTEAR